MAAQAQDSNVDKRRHQQPEIHGEGAERARKIATLFKIRWQVGGALVDATAEHAEQGRRKPFAERGARPGRGIPFRRPTPKRIEEDAGNDERDSEESPRSHRDAEYQPPHKEWVDQARLDNRPDDGVRPPLHRASHQKGHQVVECAAQKHSRDNENPGHGRASVVREESGRRGHPADEPKRHAYGADQELVAHKTVALPLDMADGGPDGNPAESGDDKE